MSAAVTEVPMLTIATDGCCIGNPGPGAWAFVVDDGSGVLATRSGWSLDTTNNRAEMVAVIRALEHLAPGQRALLLSDSEITVRGCNEWRFGWKAKGWRNSKRAAVANADLWKRLDALLEEYGDSVRIQWVKGHAGHPLNEAADQLAERAARRAQKELLAGG